MGRNLYIDKIVLTPFEYQEWVNNRLYLSFDEGLMTFEDACDSCGIHLQPHYDSEDEYNDALFELECELYWNGYYSCDDDYGFEDASEALIEWEFIQVEGHWVIIRACAY